VRGQAQVVILVAILRKNDPLSGELALGLSSLESSGDDLVRKLVDKLRRDDRVVLEGAPEIRTVCYVVALLHQSHQRVAN
jgi:hypothetical protein